MVVIDVVLHEVSVNPGEDLGKQSLGVMFEEHAAYKQMMDLATSRLPQAGVVPNKILQA